MSTYNTNLAAEFYVLSMLYRVGADATLTLGNKKAVDIVVIHDDGQTVTVDVKGVAGPYDWPANNVRIPEHNRHFYVLVSFEGKIEDHDQAPSVWVIPARELRPFMQVYKSRTVVSRAAIRRNGSKYKNAWHQI